MKKLNVILKESTIVDFEFLGELCKRYFLIAILTPLVTFGIGIFHYKKQLFIYQQSWDFKSLDTEGESSNSAIAALLGEKSSKLSKQEVVGIVQNRDFYRHLAEDLVSHDRFEDLNLTPVRAAKMISHQDMFDGCEGDPDCKVGIVKGSVPSLFEVVPDSKIPNKFLLKVHSVDPLTTQIILEETRKQILNERRNQISHTIEEQIKVAKTLVEQKKEEFDLDSHVLRLEKKLKLSRQLSSLDREIYSFENTYFQSSQRYNEVKNRAEATKKEFQEYSKSDRENDYVKKLESRVLNIREDISALKVAGLDGVQTAKILEQLKSELKERTQELEKMGIDTKSLGESQKSEDNYYKSAGAKSRNYEFDYKILGKQQKRLRALLEKKLSEQRAKEEELAKLETQIKKYQPEVKYLTLLQEKLSHLRLMHSTVVEDLVFDNNKSEVAKFKPVSLGKTVVFCIALSIFLSFVLIIGRYLLDDRIYNEYELEKNFENLAVLGITPDFKEPS